MEQQLIDALKESINYLTLAVFSFIACFSMIKALEDRKRTKIKTKWWELAIFGFYIILFLILGAVSIVLIFWEFEHRGAPVWILGIVGFIAVLAIINAVSTVYGKIESFRKNKEMAIDTSIKVDDSITQLLNTNKYMTSWLIQMDNENVVFSRIINGKVDEVYEPVSYDKSRVYAAFILNGFQPPKDIYKTDK